MEEKEAVLSEAQTDRKSVSQVNDYCFNPLSPGMVCCAVIDKTRRSAVTISNYHISRLLEIFEKIKEEIKNI